MPALISPEDLLRRLAADRAADSTAAPAGVTLLDVRWRLGADDGREQYRSGHLPGAAYVDLETELARPPHDPAGGGGRHPLPDPAVFGAAMRRCGVRADRPVVVYDDVAGRSAARAWWLLRHHGHPDVRLLDGGWSVWQRLGGPVEAGDVHPQPGDWVPGPGVLTVLDADGAAAVARDGVLVDARAPERFRGDVEPVDPVAGHVPGAHNVPTDANVVGEGERAGRFHEPAVLRRTYAAAVAAAERGAPVAASCGSGVTAAHDLVALAELGLDAGLYAGSWSGWVSDPTRPVATG